MLIRRDIVEMGCLDGNNGFNQIVVLNEGVLQGLSLWVKLFYIKMVVLFFFLHAKTRYLTVVQKVDLARFHCQMLCPKIQDCSRPFSIQQCHGKTRCLTVVRKVDLARFHCQILCKKIQDFSRRSSIQRCKGLTVILLSNWCHWMEERSELLKNISAKVCLLHLIFLELACFKEKFIFINHNF